MTIDNLQTLLAPLNVIAPVVFIKDLTLDSRCVSFGDVFIAIHGYEQDGRFYILDAIHKGAIAVISEINKNTDNKCIDYIDNIPIVYVNDLKNYLSLISRRFYRDPSCSMKVIGVTGTNGKTTVSHLLFQWAHLLSEKTAVMGTIGNGTFNDFSLSTNTTVSSVEVQRMLANFYKKGINIVFMEVSSHALVQNRVRDVCFQAAIFTNLTHDHLDYHGNMIAYKAAKWKLFSELDVKKYIINGDDCVGFEWLSKLFNSTAVTWRRKLPDNWKNKWLNVVSVFNHSTGFDILFDSSWGRGLIHSQLLGGYNIINLLLALATLLTLDYPLSLLLDKASQLRSVSGRMEIFRVLGFPTVIVDYAHTPDALKKVLLEIRLYCFGEIWCVFGCGGDRDQTKRSVMGEIAGRYSDNIIITNDNPRNEDPEDIINDIKSGLIDFDLKYLKVIPNRKEALNVVVSQAKKNDWILVSGKGHENYQIIGNKKFVYSDQVIIRNLLGIEE